MLTEKGDKPHEKKKMTHSIFFFFFLHVFFSGIQHLFKLFFFSLHSQRKERQHITIEKVEGRKKQRTTIKKNPSFKDQKTKSKSEHKPTLSMTRLRDTIDRTPEYVNFIKELKQFHLTKG